MSQAGLPIVVGVDDSDQGRAALDWALAEAERRQAQVVIAHSWTPDNFAMPAVAGAIPDWSQSEELNKGNEAAARDWLAALAARAGTSSGVTITTALNAGSPAGHLIGLADGASMIVVGSRGRGGLKGLVLGSTSHQVASHATCPVVVLRTNDDASDPKGPVVVGVDGSPASNAALRAGYNEAQLRGAQLVLLHAWSTSFAGTLATTGASLELVRAGEIDEGWRTLSESLIALRAAGGTDVVVDERLVQGSPAAALVDASKGASLVVVGSRGLGGFKELMLGSVSAAVLHHAHAPVMVIRT